jgi:hypothetical protein
MIYVLGIVVVLDAIVFLFPREYSAQKPPTNWSA